MEILVNGMHMYFEVTGHGEPLLLLHGFTGIGSDWNIVFPKMPDKFRCILPDLRGHGRSTNPLSEYSFRQCALDVYTLLDSMGFDKFKAIGVSGGGQTLLHMGTQQPGRVEAMVLVSTAPYFPEQARAIMRQMTPDSHSEAEWAMMRRRHVLGDDQIRALWTQAHGLHSSFTDVNFTPPTYPRSPRALSSSMAIGILCIPSTFPANCINRFPHRNCGSYPTRDMG